MIKKKEKISTSQLMFSIGCFIQGSALLTSGIHSFAKQEAWIAVLTGCLIALPILWMYSSLAKKFPGKSLIEINDAVLGRVVGKLFSILYILYFLSLTFLNTRDLGNFINKYLLPVTPMPVVLTVFVFVCCFAVRKGVKTMTRYATLFVISAVTVLFFTFVLLVKNIRISNFLPMFSLPLINYFEAAHIVAMLPICEILVFFMLFPHMQNTAESGKALRGGFVIGAISLLLIVMRDTAVLGPLTTTLTLPAFSVTRLINIGHFLTRMDVLFAVILVMLLFFKVSVLLYSAVFGISQLLKLSSYKFLISTVGAITVIFAIAIFNSVIEHSNWETTGAGPVYATFFLLIMPAVTITVAVIRGFFTKKEAEM